MAYNKTTWQNLPSTNTPLSASNLNKIENELEYLDNDIQDESETILTGTIDSNLTTINTSNIDLTLYKAIVVQIGQPDEGDSKVFIIASDGTIVNNIAHFDMYAGENYYCRGFASIKITNGTIGYVSIMPKELAGWNSLTAKVVGLKR